MLKAAIKQSTSSQIQNRVIPSSAIQTCAKQLEVLRSEVAAVLNEEKEEKAIRQADMEVTKGQNMIEHEEEIFGRPKRTWFQTEKEKQKAKGKLDLEPKRGLKAHHTLLRYRG
jgi:ATP-dependent RNA helicase DDX27